MKSLTTVQKTFHVFQILARIGTILSFVWAGFSALGLTCAILWSNGGSVIGADQALMLKLTETGGLQEMTAVLITSAIVALTDGVLMALAHRYFRAEQADGTPFTHRGARQLRRLGVQIIVYTLLALIVAEALCAACGLPLDASKDLDNLGSVVTGVVLILASLIFRYGADLESRVNAGKNGPARTEESHE